jgi:hypothetical protein
MTASFVPFEADSHRVCNTPLVNADICSAERYMVPAAPIYLVVQVGALIILPISKACRCCSLLDIALPSFDLLGLDVCVTRTQENSTKDNQKVLEMLFYVEYTVNHC